MKSHLNISEKDITQDTNESDKSPSPFDAINESIPPDHFFKELVTKEDYLVQRLKEDIAGGVEVVGNSVEQYGGVETLTELLEMCDQMYVKADSQRLYDGFLGIMQSIDELKEQIKHWHDHKIPLVPEKTKGKKRIHHAINFYILKSIDFCETYKLSLDWLKDFLLPSGELYDHLIGKYGTLDGIQLSVPTNSEHGKTWLDSLKETSERSLFGIKKATDPEFIRKKKELYEKIKPLNEELYNYYTAHLDEVIAKYDNI